jgi:RNA polymerase sigma-70 factor (ECF subfamily)
LGHAHVRTDAMVCAFNELRPELIAAFHFSLGNFEDAQDAVQETFLKCWRSRASIDRVRNLRAWIFRVGWNSAKDLQRNAFRRRARPLTIARTPTTGPSPLAHAEEIELQSRIRQALLTLRSDEKEVFLLRQNQSLTYDQISKLRDAPIGTVKSQMRSAIAKLRRALGEQ